MTAQLVTQTDRRDLTRTIQGLECYAWTGDTPAARLQRATPGQLWERVAENRRLNGAVLETSQWLSMCDVRNDLGTRRHGLGSERGPRVCSAIVDCGRHLCFVGTLTGNDLRAWRVGAARPYIAQHVHTGFECGAL